MGHLHRRLIVFDLDGTLIDSLRDLADSANHLISELGGVPLDQDAVGLMVGEGARVLVARALRAAGLDRDGDADWLSRNLNRFLEIYGDRLMRHTRPYPGIEDALAAAREHARLAVLTNKPTGATEKVLAGLRLTSFFTDIVGGDAAWPRKPDPASLLHLMKEADATESRTLLVGDSLIDYETASRAGARCCLAAYGFGFRSFPTERLTPDDWTVRAPGELPAVFDAFVRATPRREGG